MARINVNNITKRGTNAAFIEAMAKAPNVWQKYCDIIPSDAPDENYVWLGTLPVPNLELNGRNFQTMQDFTFTVANQAHEMSFIIDRDDLADDRHGTFQKRITEAAEAWGTYDDFLFAALLEAGAASTATFDGTEYYTSTRAIGKSANIDNLTTSAAGTDLDPTATEILSALRAIIALMSQYQDDRGRVGFNAAAMKPRLSCIIQPDYVRGFTEAMNSTTIGTSTTFNSNPWGMGLVDFDELPYLTAATITFYACAIGGTRMPFIFQEREKLEVEVFTDSKDIADNGGLKVLTRRRFRFGYGDPRRSVSHVFT